MYQKRAVSKSRHLYLRKDISEAKKDARSLYWNLIILKRREGYKDTFLIITHTEYPSSYKSIQDPLCKHLM